MTGAPELRALAARKRQTAALARRTGPSLSANADRILLLQHAEDLEGEAAALDVRAAAIEENRPVATIESQPSAAELIASY